ncbi:hypothetical protein [Ekhidna sp. To15]|uniref:hypothetical protein n=1 Tax=Ekhidna sp. To15 TaxID=3395267 RepID=UPI003F52038D
MNILKSIGFCLIALSTTRAQQPLTHELLEESAIRFSLNAEGQIEGEARKKWLEWIGNNQFVGLGEVHNSAQLSLFTKGLLNLLDEKGFEHFAMEMGPNTSSVLEEKINGESHILDVIKMLNQAYGKKSSYKTPLVFVNKVEDAEFVEAAANLNFNFWGIDQEYAGSYEMLIDQIYANSNNTDGSFANAYTLAKATVRKVIFRNKYQGQSVYCWYSSSQEINNFFSQVENETSLKIIEDIRMSWDIYCKHSQGGSNQIRANYMKKNFDYYLAKYGQEAKVFTKLGGIHLTHGKSTFGVDDIGKYLTEKSQQSDRGFLNIRHLIAYRNGKSNIGKSGWKTVTMFLELGRKDQWTVVDLRPFREMLKRGEITTTKKYTFELMSYDLLLISPDDQYPKVNY